MNRPRFYFVIFLCATFILLSIVETCLYQSWDNAVVELRDHQAKAAYAEHLDLFTDQLIRRTATDALRDPALMELMKKQGIKIRTTFPGAPSDGTPSSSDAPAPATGLPSSTSPSNEP